MPDRERWAMKKFFEEYGEGVIYAAFGLSIMGFLAAVLLAMTMT